MIISKNKIGSNIWWKNLQRQGTPIIEFYKENIFKVTFFWQDPNGNEFNSYIKRVWINIIGITDHHQSLSPVSLVRIPNTDVWYWQTKLSAFWRGSYFFIPDIECNTYQNHLNINERRQWWSKKFSLSQIDKFNPYKTWISGRGIKMSSLHLPKAPCQLIWQSIDKTKARIIELKQITWASKLLCNRRSIWFYNTAKKNNEIQFIAILLDGNFWVKNMPIIEPIQKLTNKKEIPPAIYVMIDNINNHFRKQELTCNPTFWLAIKEELIPKLYNYMNINHKTISTLVIGQSLGGLSAVYAVLNWPQYFTHAISISGSFWWPKNNNPYGIILNQIKQQSLLYKKYFNMFYIETGIYEKLIRQSNEILKERLIKYGYHVKYQLFVGGHDAICWRGSVLNGIKSICKFII